MGVKRYVLVIFLGTSLVALAGAMFLAYVYRTFDVPDSAGWIVYGLTLQWISHPWREIGIGLFGLVVMVAGGLLLFKSLLSVVIRPGEDLAEIVYRGRKLQRGPRIVSIGGGTGQGILLRGLKEQSANLTAVVTVADDGGSSGRLRKDFQLVAPGDLRNCLTSLADSESLMTRLVDYRFSGGEGLEGHSLGNLLLAAMRDIEGSMDKGIESLSEVLRIHGKIAPSTMEDVHLAAELEDGTTVIGESRIGGRGSIKRVFLQPRNVIANDEAVSALLAADIIVIGPGSVYTSILPNLLVGELSRAIRSSQAVKIYVCNVATEPGETDRFSTEDHVRVLHDHVAPGLFQFVLANSYTAAKMPNHRRETTFVQASAKDQATLGSQGLEVITTDVLNHEEPEHHDPIRLADAIMEIYASASGSSQVLAFSKPDQNRDQL